MSGNKYHTYSFEKLEVWQLARKIRNQIYEHTRTFPDEEKYGVTSQIRRSSNSVTDNIAEGSGRASNFDRAHFTNIAYTSALETVNQLIASSDQKYISERTYRKMRIQMDELMNKLNSFYKHQLNDGISVKEKLRK